MPTLKVRAMLHHSIEIAKKILFRLDGKVWSTVKSEMTQNH